MESVCLRAINVNNNKIIFRFTQRRNAWQMCRFVKQQGGPPPSTIVYITNEEITTFMEKEIKVACIGCIYARRMPMPSLV